MNPCNGWVETSGYGSVKGPICPYCQALGTPADCKVGGYGDCFFCKRRYRWVAGQTPVGFAWQTFTLADSQSASHPSGDRPTGG